MVNEREDASADRHAWLALMSGVLPRLTIRVDLLALLHVQRLAGLVIFEGRALEIHPELRRPSRRRIRAGTPPDAIAQPFRMGLQAKQSGWVGKHWPRVRLRESVALEYFEKGLGMPS